MNEFKPGDVVVLKSDQNSTKSIFMTVTMIAKNIVSCVYVDPNNVSGDPLKRIDLPKDSIILKEQPKRTAGIKLR